MSGINVTVGSFVPAAVASGAAVGGATAGEVHMLPTTGAGTTLLILIGALGFVVVGAVLTWNPLQRRPGPLPADAGWSVPPPLAAIAPHAGQPENA